MIRHRHRILLAAFVILALPATAAPQTGGGPGSECSLLGGFAGIALDGSRDSLVVGAAAGVAPHAATRGRSAHELHQAPAGSGRDDGRTQRAVPLRSRPASRAVRACGIRDVLGDLRSRSHDTARVLPPPTRRRTGAQHQDVQRSGGDHRRRRRHWGDAIRQLAPGDRGLRRLARSADVRGDDRVGTTVVPFRATSSDSGSRAIAVSLPAVASDPPAPIARFSRGFGGQGEASGSGEGWACQP